LPKLPETFGKYVLVERIAAGGMAEVFRAVMRGAAGFEKPVALKRILPAFGEEPDFVVLFQDEARIASTLSHANIAQVFDFGEVDGVYYLALELVHGLDLAKFLGRLKSLAQPLPLPAAAFIVAEIARGLAYAHEARAGLVHRDVSPANILLSRTGEVKIADFGIAKAAGKVHRTEAGVLMGKLRYMSPEQVEGEDLDGRSDVFSLGIVLYELVTGGPVFSGDPGVKLADLIRTAPIEPPSARNPAISPVLDAIVLKALARDRNDRYSTAYELLRDLTAYLSKEAPGYSREDLAALVRAAVPDTAAPEPTHPPLLLASAPPRTIEPIPRSEVAKPRRKPGPLVWAALGIAFVLLGSGTLLLVRFALPGTDRAADARPRSIATVTPADAGVEPVDTGPFRLVGTATAEERRALSEEVDKRSVTRRGVPTPDYLAFLSAVDAKLALMTVEADGRAGPPGELPRALEADVARTGVGDAVDAVVGYVRKTGELPPLVRSAARSFLAGRSSVAPEEQMGTPPYAAAALAVWLEPTRRRLTELAWANDLQWRWCEPVEAPRRRFAPILCEREALIAALRATDPRDRVAAALERWSQAQPWTDATVLRSIYRAGTRSGIYELSVTVHDNSDGAFTYRVVAAGLDSAVDVAPVVFAPTLFFEVPRKIIGPVLGIKQGDGELFVRLRPPPWGGAQ
jgi:serine/threonine-protein kinase